MSKPLSPHDETGPEMFPSLPPSPTLLEEDLSRPRMWRDDEEGFEMQDSQRSPGSGSSNGKGKSKRSLEVDEDDEDDEDTVENHNSSHEVYPPTTDAAAETRKVEETLKRWELAERQRRKSARESAQPSSGPSLLADVTRKASLILSKRKPSLRASGGNSLGNHRALKSRESVDLSREGYGVPLDDIDQNSPSASAIAVHSPSPSVFEHSTSENPFMHPSESLELSTPSLSPFADSKEQSAVMIESAIPPTPFSPEVSSGPGNQTFSHEQLAVLPSTMTLVPPPRPLGLPPPVTPPPPADTPHLTQLRPTPPPVLSPSPHLEPEDRKEVRWWHDWLCGCGEGPDRGGDNQAGRTNPFE
ncbi:hypothetical protein HYDPIDRAFT_107445 [Hydnomerulius pinastri MD-312]|nr:hypothetical protein HYDPIDRAFT_107445 [Hydnomerulius pinastri MD-312]